MSRGRPGLLVFSRGGVGVLAVWLVLLGSVQAGLAVPTQEVLASSVGTGAELDYGRVVGSVAPLTDEFVAQALGLPPPTAGGPLPVSAPAPAGEPGRQPASGADTTDPGIAPGTRVVVTHPPDNDHFAQAYEVPSVPFTARTDARSASRQPGEPGSCAPTGPTLWYRYVPQRTSGLVATTIGTRSATSLGVFTGSGLRDLTPVGCDTDVAGDAHVAFEAVEGATYFFQVGAPVGGGPTVFSLDPAGVTERISLTSDGEEIGGAHYWMGATSADGRYVAFQSLSSELVPDDRNAAWDVFVKDRLTGAVERVSVASDGTEADDHSWSLNVDISADGRFVVFYSWASNLVPEDTNDQQDAFVHDRLTGQTSRVSVSSSGRQGERHAEVHPRTATMRADCQLRPRGDTPFIDHENFPCFEWIVQLSMTPDGSLVLFESSMVGLVDGEDAEPALVESEYVPPFQVYAHDRRTGETVRVSVDATGEPGDAASGYPAVSADGRLVAFWSLASDLVPGVDPGGVAQLYLTDLISGETRLITRALDGGPSNAEPFMPSISADGGVVAFVSLASDLVEGDRNEFADAFAYDVANGRIELVSVSTDGHQQQVNKDVTERARVGYFYALVSDDGRYVAFDSPADNLSPRDEPRPKAPLVHGPSECLRDVFLRDRAAGTTLLVSVNSRGEQANNCSWLAGLSPSGAEVVFLSPADNLVEDDTNGGDSPTSRRSEDLFVHSLAGVS